MLELRVVLEPLGRLASQPGQANGSRATTSAHLSPLPGRQGAGYKGFYSYGPRLRLLIPSFIGASHCRLA